MSELREQLGELVRDAWVEWAKRQPNPKPDWLTPWKDLAADDPQRDADRYIGIKMWGHFIAEHASALAEKMLDREYEKQNDRRNELCPKKVSGTLTADEEAEFELLQAACKKYRDVKLPYADNDHGERLRELQERLGTENQDG